MTTTSLVKKLMSTKWWVEANPGSIFLFDYIMRAFVLEKHLTGYPTLKHLISIYKDGVVSEITPYREKTKNFYFLLNRELKNPGYVKKLFAPWRKLLKTKMRFLNKQAISAIHKYSKKKLLKFARELTYATLHATIYGTFIECLDPFSEQWREEFSKKYRLKNTNDTFIILSRQPQRSFLTQERLDFLSLCLKKMTLKKYLEKWYWFNTNYARLSVITLKNLKSRIEKELKKRTKQNVRQEIKKILAQEKELIEQKRQTKKIVKLNKKDKVIFKLLETLGFYLDLRKESMVKFTYSRDCLLKEIQKRTKYPLWQLRNMLDNEVVNILKGQKIDIAKIKTRYLQFATYYTPKKNLIFHQQQAEALYKSFIKSLETGELKGQVASAPTLSLSGRASIVIDVHRDKFKTGNILVTTMTRPEFMPLMRKACAVITDEGGVTCHAAIVSRELNIPCIIGTKKATKILKNNQKITLDLNNGAIKALK